MTIRDLIPWGRDTNQTPAVYRDNDRDPFMALHREMNRLSDDVFRGFDTRLPSFGALPRVASIGRALRFPTLRRNSVSRRRSPA